MLLLRYPKGAWNWAGTALILLLVVAPVLVTLLLSPAQRTWTSASTVAQLAAAPVILGAALLVYFRHRLTDTPPSAWATLCLAVYGVENAVLAGIRAGEADSFFRRPGWVLLIDLALGLAVLALVRNLHRFPARVDPLAAGLLVGLLVGVMHLQLNARGPALEVAHLPMAVLTVAVWTAACVLAVRADHQHRWYSVRFAAGSLLLVVAHVAASWSSTGPAHLAVILTSILGAVLLLSASIAGLRHVILHYLHHVHRLRRQLTDLEAHDRDQRARLHEITSTVAGIAGASSLIHSEVEMPAARRQLLEEMLDREAARLARILRHGDRVALSASAEPPAPAEPAPAAADEPAAGGAVGASDPEPARTEASTAENGTAEADGTQAGRTAPDAASAAQRRRPHPHLVDLDEVLRPLVVAQQAVGRTVRWAPSGLRVLGDPDDMAEALNILLDNARKHAPGATTTVSVTRDGRDVRVVVADDGPGIAPEVGDRIFEWGARGADSAGQGLGLHLAQQRLQESGSTLHLAPGTSGATFVARLPAADPVPALRVTGRPDLEAR